MTCAVIGNYKHATAALSTIVNGDGMFETEDVVAAIYLLNILRTENFCFNAIITQKILGLVKPVDSVLQNQETDLTKALALVESTAKVMENLRNDKACEELWIATVKLRESAEFTEQTEESNGRPDFNKRHRKITSRLDDYYVTESIGNPEENDEDESMRKRMLYQCLDVILDEIKLRFNENQCLSEALSRKSPNFLDRSALPLSRLHVEIPSIAELKVAKQYLLFSR